MFLRDIISRLGGEAIGEVAHPLNGVGTVESSGNTHITFLANPKYRAALAHTGAGAVIVGTKDPARWRKNAALLEAGPLPDAQYQAIRARWKQVADTSWTGQT